MKKGKVCGLAAGIVLYSAVLAGIFYFAGSRSASDTAGEYPDIQTFYAQVTDISIDDIDVGDNIAVSFFGEVMESYPAKLTQVTQLTLLDDEK